MSEQGDRVGVIGIGQMGMGVARSLLRAGYPLRVRDIRPEAEAEARAAGARVRDSARALAADCDVIITLVVDADQTEDVVFGEEGVASGVAPGAVLMMCSTVAPDYAASLWERLQGLGVEVIDAPVSGGPARAHDGTLSMMLAGAESALARADPVLQAISAKRFVVGPRPGDGSRAKIVNNLLAGVNLVAGCEAIALAQRLGLDPSRVLDIVMASSGASWIVEDRMRRVLAGDFSPRAALAILTKDLGLALDAARHAGVDAPVTTAARDVYLRGVAAGLSAEDDAALLKLYSRI